MHNLKTINVAHSPDADDIFMYAAVKFGWVSSKNLVFTSKALDIETLNEEALKGTYEATAISFALIRIPYSLKKAFYLSKPIIRVGFRFCSSIRNLF